jgi:hypothetical protein
VTYKPEEEGGLVGLECLPWVDGLGSSGVIICNQHRSGAQCFNELMISAVAESRGATYLLEGLVVDKASSVLGNLELALLDLLSKLPAGNG